MLCYLYQDKVAISVAANFLEGSILYRQTAHLRAYLSAYSAWEHIKGKEERREAGCTGRLMCTHISQQMFDL